MSVVFAAFALVAALVTWMMPHLAHGLGPDMVLVYLGLAVAAALLQLFRPQRRR